MNDDYLWNHKIQNEEARFFIFVFVSLDSSFRGGEIRG